MKRWLYTYAAVGISLYIVLGLALWLTGNDIGASMVIGFIVISLLVLSVPWSLVFPIVPDVIDALPYLSFILPAFAIPLNIVLALTLSRRFTHTGD